MGPPFKQKPITDVGPKDLDLQWRIMKFMKKVAPPASVCTVGELKLKQWILAV